MKYFTSHNLLLEAAPIVFPLSSSREHICSSHKTATQPLSLPTEKQIYTHQHSCSCNLVPFLEPLAAVSASSPLCESSPALHFLAPREMVGLPLKCASSVAWASMPVGHPTPTHLHQAALLSTGAMNCRELFLWSWSDTAGTRATTRRRAVAHVTMAHQHYLLCSAGFKFRPVFYSGAHRKHPSSFSQMWQGVSIYRGMFFPVASSNNWNQKPQPRIWSSSHPTSSKLNFGQVRKCLALPVF